jgi:hypothetical protein
MNINGTELLNKLIKIKYYSPMFYNNIKTIPINSINKQLIGVININMLALSNNLSELELL